MILSFGGKSPRDEGAAFVADNATVQGDVLLKPGTTVWYGAVLRGDSGTLTIGENTNIQDNAVLHCDAGGKVLLGRNITVGHCALVHGCTVGDDSLIGMHATLLNHSVVGKRCIIGAGALVPITGFANAVASSAIDAKSEGFILGVGAKIFQIAGPVILYGVSASVVYGILYWIVTLF